MIPQGSSKAVAILKQHLYLEFEWLYRQKKKEKLKWGITMVWLRVMAQIKGELGANLSLPLTVHGSQLS